MYHNRPIFSQTTWPSDDTSWYIPHYLCPAGLPQSPKNIRRIPGSLFRLSCSHDVTTLKWRHAGGKQVGTKLGVFNGQWKLKLLGKLFWPHCDLTGIMVSKGNDPHMALIQVSEILKFIQKLGDGRFDLSFCLWSHDLMGWSYPRFDGQSKGKPMVFRNTHHECCW